MINKPSNSFQESTEFVINDYLTLKLEEGNTNIYLKGVLLHLCKFLLLNIPVEHVEEEEFEEIESIDIIADRLGWTYWNEVRIISPDPETEFWGHCSSLQAWAENGYDTRLLHSKLAFPLLKKLVDAGDPRAQKAFKEEIVKRIASGYPNVVIYLLEGRYLRYLTGAELESALDKTSFPKIISVVENIKTPKIVPNLLKQLLNAIRRTNLLEEKLPMLFDMVEGMKFDPFKVVAFEYLLQMIRDANFMTTYAPRIEEFCNASIDALETIGEYERFEVYRKLYLLIQRTVLLSEKYLGLLVNSFMKGVKTPYIKANFCKQLHKRGTGLLEKFLPKLLNIVERMKFDKDKISALDSLLKATQDTGLIKEYASRIEKICDATINALESVKNYEDKAVLYTNLVKILKTTPLRQKYKERIKNLMVIAEINVFDWKEEVAIEYMFRDGGTGYRLDHTVVDWNIYEVESGGDSYIYVVANNKPTIKQLKEVSDMFRFLTKDHSITRETYPRFEVTGVLEEEEEEEEEDKDKLKKIDPKNFKSLDSF